MTSATARLIDKTLGGFGQMLRSPAFHWLYASLLNLGFWLGYFVKTGALHQAARMALYILALPFALHLLVSMIRQIPYAAMLYRRNAHWHDHHHFRR